MLNVNNTQKLNVNLNPSLR